MAAAGEEIEPDDPKDRFRKKVLQEFRCRVQDAILGSYLLGRSMGIDHLLRRFPRRDEGGGGGKDKEELREISLWGVPLLPSKGHESTDVVLMKFLRANDFKVIDAFEMLRRTLIWRRKFGAEGILGEDSGPDDPESAAALSNCGNDRQGRPLCFDMYGDLKEADPQGKTLGFEERCEKLLRLRVRSMEKGIERINFRPGEANSLVLITDLRNLRGAGTTKEIRAVSKKVMLLMQENYPELIHRNIIINVPFWYYTFHAVVSRFISQRTRSKFVFARPKRVTHTLLRFIAPENIPIQYGGFKREKEDEFSPTERISEIAVKGGDTGTIQIPISEVGVTAVWDVAVVGSEAGYSEEFIPDDECSYTILLKKEKKLNSRSVRNSFYISEPGRIVITINNGTFNKKRVLYRYKTRPTVPMYVVLKH